jgi:hypothetical protein
MIFEVYPCTRRRLIKVYVRLMGFAICLIGLFSLVASINLYCAFICGIEGWVDSSNWLIALQFLGFLVTTAMFFIGVLIGKRFLGRPEGDNLI